MRGRRVIAFVTLAVSVTGAQPVFGWGFLTHRLINERAVDTLPHPLRAYFAARRERLSDLAIEPDTIRRKRYGKREAVRHYIDLDLYGDPPFSELPRARAAAKRRFGSDVVAERGTLPWTLLEYRLRLIRDMKRGDWEAVLRTAGHAGHYLGDAFMPLHTTDNHDGQKTGNRGIHKTLERTLVDARLERYAVRIASRIRPATIRGFDANEVFAILLESHSDVERLLRADTIARRFGRPASEAYLGSLDAAVGELLATRIATAISTLGSFWLSAWDAAGRPSLP